MGQGTGKGNAGSMTRLQARCSVENGGVAERSIAPGCKLGALQGYAGSNPAPATSNEGERRAHVAQLVEHVLGKNGVTGSSPVVGSSVRKIT